MRTCGCSVRASLASLDLAMSRALSWSLMVCRPACSMIPQKMRRSKSSPPRAESPLVAMTSNTPLVSRRMEMSKVPPPRS